MTITAFPLSWPPGWRRTEDDMREFGRFGVRRQTAGRSYASLQDISVAEASRRLLDELERMRVQRDSIILSTNLKLRLDGLPRSDQAAPKDPGAAVYWEDPYNGQPRTMAIDQYTKVEQNIAALAATIEAMRAIERHGGASFWSVPTGFTALPAPIVAGIRRDWQVVLELQDLLLPTREDVEKTYRRLASRHHPDKGGSHAAMSELNQARNDALRECS